MRKLMGTLAICMLSGVVANAALVIELQENLGDVTASPITAVSDDLLQTAFGSVTGEASAVVRDGVVGTAREGNGTHTGLWLDNGGLMTTTYNLDVSVNTFGYDIEDVRVFTGWDSNRAQAGYDIYYSVVGSATFTLLATVGSPDALGGTVNSSADAMFMTRTYDDGGGTIAGLTGVDAIQFQWDFSSGLDPDRGPVFREIDVLGSSTIPEPATLGLITAFGGGILFIRRRFMI